jgi:hypothetical protein
MDFFALIGKYFWLMIIGVAVANYFLADRFGDSGAEEGVDGALRRKYLGWFWGLSIVPWLVMGYGQVVGGVPNVWALFRPQDRNPHVWAVYASILAVYAIVVYWVLFRDGARIAAELRLLKYQAPGKSGALSAFWIKVMAIGAFPFFALWLWIASQMNVPIP